MSVAHDKVYLITNVAFPGHFLTDDDSMQSFILASTTRVTCWHLTKDGDNWVLNSIGSPVRHQLIYSGTTTYSLKMQAEDKGKAFISNSACKLKLTATTDASFTGFVSPFKPRMIDTDGLTGVARNYEISISKDDKTWLAAIGTGIAGTGNYHVEALTRDDTKPGNQQWKFLKMPA